MHSVKVDVGPGASDDPDDKNRSTQAHLFVGRARNQPRKIALLVLLVLLVLIIVVRAEFTVTAPTFKRKKKLTPEEIKAGLMDPEAEVPAAKLQEVLKKNDELVAETKKVEAEVHDTVEQIKAEKAELKKKTDEAMQEWKAETENQLRKLKSDMRKSLKDSRSATTQSIESMKLLMSEAGRVPLDPSQGNLGRGPEMGDTGEIRDVIPEYEPDQPLPDPIQENQRRLGKVKDGFMHAWKGYKQFAWGHDELQPLSHKGKDWLKGNVVGFGTTILDAMTTLWVMGFHEEFDVAIDWVQKNLDFNKDSDMSCFESTIRMLGGLLSAYELSGEKHRWLVEKATSLADRLLHSYNTTTGIPHATVNLKTLKHQNPRWAGGASVLSEFGTVQMEMKTLSYHTGNPVYDKKAMNIINVIRRHMPPDGLTPTYMDPRTAKWTTDHVTLGALGDSYYEYLLKSWLLTGQTEDQYKDMYTQAARGITKKLIKKSHPSGQTYIAQYKRGSIVHKMDHLACFAGGMFALGAQTIKGPDADKWMEIGAGITETCHLMYKSTRTGLAAEVSEFRSGSDMTPGPAYYILRPETIEAFFYMWRFTKDQKYRDWGWEMFLAAERWCKVETGGYSGIKNVNVVPPQKDDLMQSFWLAETMKYLYLLFADDDALKLDEWVINTEAHPLKIRKRVLGEDMPNYWEDPSVIPPHEAQEGYIVDHHTLQGSPVSFSSPVSGYILKVGMDAAGADITGPSNPVKSKDGNFIAQQCNADPRCKGFNTNGYMKTEVTHLTPERNCNLYIKEDAHSS
mmetsp:Transcript_71341/g.125575  ORF Transcript_71341/g.125575 Transcript_71341/m.125575 type:complete len:792 (-) Transcript_71341:54-2429(-)